MVIAQFGGFSFPASPGALLGRREVGVLIQLIETPSVEVEGCGWRVLVGVVGHRWAEPRADGMSLHQTVS